MSGKSTKIAVMAASLGMVLTPSSAPRAEAEDGGLRGVTNVTASVALDEDVFYSAVSDEVLEIAANTTTTTQGQLQCTNGCVGRPVVTKPTSRPPAIKSPGVK